MVVKQAGEKKGRKGRGYETKIHGGAESISWDFLFFGGVSRGGGKAQGLRNDLFPGTFW